MSENNALFSDLVSKTMKQDEHEIRVARVSTWIFFAGESRVKVSLRRLE